MRHVVDHRKLGRTASHRRALLSNLVTSLILNERVETTLPKAKELRSLADRMITWGKQGDLAARREAARTLQTPKALQKLFDGLAKRFGDRSGGYTRLIRFGNRRGDGAPMAAIEYLGYQLPLPKEKKKEAGEIRKERPIVVEKKGAEPAEKATERRTAKKSEEEGKKPQKRRWGLFRRKEPK